MSMGKDVNQDTVIIKKKPIVMIIVLLAIIVVAGVLLYFTFFSTAAVLDREIKTHIANAEKYLDALDYEKAIAEYEEALKLNPQIENVLENYFDTVLLYADVVSEDNSEEATDIINNAIEFLETFSIDNEEISKQIEKLEDTVEKYTVKSDEDDSDEVLIDNEDDSEQVADIDTPYINEDGYLVFGTYEQDGDESNGPEPIEWEILDENEN